MKKNFKEIIKEICIEDNINCKFLSKDWVIMLEKDGKTRFISGYKFDSNSHGIGLIADDKYALYEVLKSKNIPIIEHKIVYNKTNNLDYAVDVFTYYSSDVLTALKGGNNIKGALIGSGVAASHGMERTHLKGLINTFKLVLLYITK